MQRNARLRIQQASPAAASAAGTWCPRLCVTQVVGIAPPVDDWIQAVQGFGVPEAMAKDLGNM